MADVIDMSDYIYAERLKWFAGVIKDMEADVEEFDRFIDFCRIFELAEGGSNNDLLTFCQLIDAVMKSEILMDRLNDIEVKGLKALLVVISNELAKRFSDSE